MAGLAQRMSGSQRFKVLLTLAIIAALVVLTVISERLWRSAPEPPKPLDVELIEMERTGNPRPTSGMSIGPDGFGTILSVPARKLFALDEQPVWQEPMQTTDATVPNQVAGLVRMFARLKPETSSNEPGMGVTTLAMPPRYVGTIVLRNGCLRLDEPGEPHVILPPYSELYVGEDGFLTINTLPGGENINPRVGEPLWWEGDNWRPLDIDAVGQIRAKCGPGAVRLIGHTRSMAASRAAADEVAARSIVQMYGLPWTSALTAARNCRIRLESNNSTEFEYSKMVENPCGNRPPLPVDDQRSCPPDTSLSSGLCRTPEGYIRPIPEF